MMLLTFDDVAPLLQAQIRHTIKQLVERFGVCESEARLLRIRLSHSTDVSRFLPDTRKSARMWMQLCAADAALHEHLSSGVVTQELIDRLRRGRKASAVEVKTDRRTLATALREGLTRYPRCCAEPLSITLAELEACRPPRQRQR